MLMIDTEAGHCFLPCDFVLFLPCTCHQSEVGGALPFLFG